MSLGAFAGKKTQVALRYVGDDGNTMFVDELAICYPQLDGISFMEPLDIQYWGFERSHDLSCLNIPIAQIPVYSDESWTNMTYIDGAEFSWSYCNPVTAEMTDGGNEETLTVRYLPDYSSENTKRNNLFYPPVLTATAPNASPGSATSSYSFLQAGGKPEYKLKDGSMLNCSLMPFLFQDKGLSIAIVDSEKYGDATLPIFGHDENTDKYWLDYTFGEDEPGADDKISLDGILNFIYPSESAMVVRGVDVFGKGIIADDAELTIRIYEIGYDYEFEPNKNAIVASATCKGSDILKDGTSDGRNTTLCIPFDFEAPAVLKAQEGVGAYVVYFTGFNSDKVEYFAPLQSQIPDDYMCLGWITKHMQVFGQDRYSTTPMADHQGEFGPYYCAFAIGLHAEHPWLTSESESVKLPADGSSVSVALGSYYDGSELDVTAPAGVRHEISGRYDECVLTLSHDDSDVVAQGDVTVSAPGVELVLPLTQSSGINDIDMDASDAKVTGVYDLSGRRINAANAGSGMYLVRYSDGSTRKVAVK